MISEEIIESLGQFGYWQRIIFVSISIPDIFVFFSLLSSIFTGATPKWSCGDYLNNGTSLQINNTSLVHGKQFYGLSSLNISSTLTPLSNESENCDCTNRIYDGGFTSIVSEFDLVCDRRYITELITTIQFTGLLLGAAIFAQLSDLFGRKKTHFTTVILVSLTAFISGFSINWQMYAVCRFFNGISAGGYFCINCVYTLEFVGRKWRTLCGTVGFWATGEMLLALIAYFIRDWRYLTIFTASCGFLVLCLWWIIPESPRWLARSGHIEEAHKVYTKIADKNGVKPPDISDIKQLVAEKDEKVQKKYTYMHLFSSRTLIKTTFVSAALWFTSFIVYYHVSFNLKNLSGDRYLNLFFAGILDIVAMFSVIFLNNIIGRRISEIFYTGVAAVCNVIILVILLTSHGESVEVWVKVFALIGKASALGGIYVNQIWSAELFPTHIRTIGVGVGSVAARIGGLLAPQIVLLGYYYELAPYIFTVVLCCLVLPLCFLLKETNKTALNDGLESEGSEAGIEYVEVKLAIQTNGLDKTPVI